MKVEVIFTDHIGKYYKDDIAEIEEGPFLKAILRGGKAEVLNPPDWTLDSLVKEEPENLIEAVPVKEEPEAIIHEAVPEVKEEPETVIHEVPNSIKPIKRSRTVSPEHREKKTIDILDTLENTEDMKE